MDICHCVHKHKLFNLSSTSFVSVSYFANLLLDPAAAAGIFLLSLFLGRPGRRFGGCTISSVTTTLGCCMVDVADLRLRCVDVASSVTGDVSSVTLVTDSLTGCCAVDSSLAAFILLSVKIFKYELLQSCKNLLI